MYTFDSRVRYSEIDHTGNMTLPALINYFQDCSTFQSEDIGLGTEVLKAKKKAWILSYWQIVIERLRHWESVLQQEPLRRNLKACMETGILCSMMPGETGLRMPILCGCLWIWKRKTGKT